MFSLDGVRIISLELFAGLSSGWTYKEYDLDNFVGDSIFVCFRCTTDSNTLEDGFYHYGVRGHNTEYGWGDFSTLEKMHVFQDIASPYR